MNDPWHILIVDDSDDDRANLRQLLLRGSTRRYRFSEVATGGAGVSAIQDLAPGTFDCVLLDLRLPDMTACEVLTALAAPAVLGNGAALPPCPVVVITGWTGSAASDGPTLLRRGAQDYLSKNWITAESLNRAVENAVERYAMLIELARGVEELRLEREHLAVAVAQGQCDAVALNVARLAAESASLAKSSFLSHMSHELRTPLHAILGFAQLMGTEAALASELQKNCLEQILKGGWYLLELINEILDLALIDSGKVQLDLVPVPVADVMLECQAMLFAGAKARGMDLSFELRGTPGWVKADRLRLKQVLLNLLSNAIKYGNPNTTVTVTCSEGAEGWVQVAIEDQSAGISAEKMSGLFQPFNRLGQEATSQEGTGIGLVVCKRLVELMGGVVGVRSTMGVGSVFWFEMNAATALVPLHIIADTPLLATSSPGAHAAHSYKLLYVEDNAANRMLMESLVSLRPDLRLMCANDGLSGLEMARTTLPDLIVLDINLPDISGTDVLAMLKADPATAHIPVLALSANAMPLDVERGLQAGFLHYVTKPIKVREFMATLDEALESTPAGPPAAALLFDLQEVQ